MPLFTHTFDTECYKGTTSVNSDKLFINNEWVSPVKPDYLDVVNPSTGKVLTKVVLGSPEDIEIAVKAARQAFKTSWGLNAPGSTRASLMNEFADLVEKNSDELGALESLSMGAQFYMGKRMVDMGAQTLRYFAGWAGKVTGKTVETNPAKFAYTRREPVGVCGQIVAWNAPLFMFLSKIAGALACGCTIVVNPSEISPLSTLRVCDLIKEAGFPPGVINVVVGYGPTVGDALSHHMDVNKISFTGSLAVGRKIATAAAESNLKRVTLELGGKSPNIILDDADLDQAVKWAANGIYGNSGQACSAGSRIFIQEGIYDRFVQEFTTLSQARKLGDPFLPETEQGPLISQVQFDRVMNYINIGKKEGATLNFGGERHGTEGFFVKPTIFTDVKPDMRIVREEIFGPVGVLIKFKTDEEVIQYANDTSYGLAAAVFTSNITRALKISNSVQAGSVFVNCHNWLEPQLPWGGYKESGWGSENGEEVLNHYTEVKAVHVNLGFSL